MCMVDPSTIQELGKLTPVYNLSWPSAHMDSQPWNKNTVFGL